MAGQLFKWVSDQMPAGQSWPVGFILLLFVMDVSVLSSLLSVDCLMDRKAGLTSYLTPT